MGASFRPYSPDQALLRPPSLNEWLAEGHLTYFISDVAEELDLSAFYARYEGDGRRKPPFDPRMMLKVLIYACANGVFSGNPDDKAQSNFTDPESRIMKTSTGFEQCYNGQLAVDGEFQIIVANDNGQLMAVLTEVDAILQAQPERCLADAGYRRESDFQALEAQGIDGYISLRRERKTIDKIDRNRYPATARMAQKLSTPYGKACYSQRKHLVEAVSG